MADKHDYENYPTMRSSNYAVEHGTPSSITKEKENIILKHITSQLNSSIHNYSRYDRQPTVPYFSYNHSDSNVTHKYDDNIAGDKTGHKHSSI